MSKQPEGKPEPTLVYRSALLETAKVRRFGINKHGSSEDWRTTAPVDHYDAAMRHLMAVAEGEWFDPESGLPHLAHALTNCMFEIERVHGKGSPIVRMPKKLKE